jgi:hypothetical protein
VPNSLFFPPSQHLKLSFIIVKHFSLRFSRDFITTVNLKGQNCKEKKEVNGYSIGSSRHEAGEAAHKQES